MPELLHGDCLELMENIPDGSVDAIICDLPYGTTAAPWDSLIDLDKLWTLYRKVLAPTGTVLLFGSQPFSSTLIQSNLEWFKYEWIWEKGRASGFLHAKNKPLKAHENILVFSRGTTVHASQSSTRMTYNPQMSEGPTYSCKHAVSNTGALNHKPTKSNIDWVGSESVNEGTRYPRSVQFYSNHNVGNIHPTQKPVPLLEYLIKTYTNEGDTVLDNCFGSCSTGIACLNTGRKFIGIEKDDKYFALGSERFNKRREELGL